MPKIDQLSPGAALDGTELVAIVQDGVTVRATTQAIANLASTGASPVISVNGQVGLVVLGAADVAADPAGTSAAGVAAHDASAGAHGGVEALFSAHDGAGGAAHALADLTDHGFMPSLSGNATDYMAGDGTFKPLPVAANNIPVERIDDTDSPYVPNADDGLILVDASAAAVDINLPTITAPLDGLVLYIKRTSAGAFAVTINRSGSDTIDGATSKSLPTQYQSWTLVASYDSGGNSFWNVV